MTGPRKRKPIRRGGPPALDLFTGPGIARSTPRFIGHFESNARLRRLACDLLKSNHVWAKCQDHSDEDTQDAAHYEAMDRMPGLTKEAEALGIHVSMLNIHEYAEAHWRKA